MRMKLFGVEDDVTVAAAMAAVADVDVTSCLALQKASAGVRWKGLVNRLALEEVFGVSVGAGAAVLVPVPVSLSMLPAGR